MASVLRVRSLLAATLCIAALTAQQTDGYRTPSKLITDLVTAEPPPATSMSPQGGFLVLTAHEALPDLEVLARPHLKLAGMRIDGELWRRQLSTRTTSIEVVPLERGEPFRVAVEPDHWSAPIWSADDRAFALVRASAGGAELWIADPCTAPPVKVEGLHLNQVLGSAVQWLPDQRRLLVQSVVPGAAPRRPRVPAGPVVQETRPGQKAQVRTYQDLLRDAHDEDLLEFYATSRLAVVDAESRAVEPFGEPRMYSDVLPSPDGTLLLVTCVRRPFSLVVPIYRFPRATLVCDFEGGVRRELFVDQLREAVPIGGVKTGPRSIGWVATAQHALYWVEAQDGGDPQVQAEVRDHVFLLPEPEGTARLWFKCGFRFAGVQFGGDGHLVLTAEVDRRTRTERLWRRDLRKLAEPGELVHERSTQDAYGDPGRPVMARELDGRRVMRMQDGRLFRSGRGASPQGDRPFVDAWRVADDSSERLFRSAEGRFETLLGFVGRHSDRFVVRSEAKDRPPELVLVEGAERRTLRSFEDPAEKWTKRVQRRIVHYQREDGVPMSGTLYLPPSYREGDQLPCLLWAYPVEFSKASDAGQVRLSPNRYLRLRGSSHLFLLLEGYAVFDNASMPIVGSRRTANDSFVEQVRMNARAAIKALGEQGCIDVDKVAVAGHSYGAFMTGNLLAHSDLFCCGIARSGAYNRSLTPFGFQNEERTFWQAPQVYFAMSPFMHAHEIDEPLLLIHGQDDNNSGTFPIQSKRLFAALKGHGATARLCFLPFESHGYRGRQSVLHCLAEMIDWLDRHCRNAAPRER